MKRQTSRTRSHHRIQRLNVIGGFLDGLDIEFADGLNCIIGPRGVGKTTILEMMRFALDTMPGRDGDPLRRRVETIVSSNLDGGRVELVVRTKDGQTYTISRAADEPPVVLDASGEPMTGVKVKGGRLFQADILSQNQMESIAENPHYQLDLIDKFSDGELAGIDWEVTSTQDQIEANARDLLPLLTRQAALVTETKELPAVEAKLKGMQQSAGPNAEAINSGHAHKALREREAMALNEIRKVCADTVRTVGGLKDRLGEDVDSLITPEILSGPNGTRMKRVARAMHEAIGNFEKLLDEAVEALRVGGKTLTSEKEGLDQEHARQETAFRQLLEKHKEAQARSAGRTAEEKRRNELLFKQRELADVTRQVKLLEAERQTHLGQLSNLFDRRFQIRHEIATTLTEDLAPTIRVAVRQCGNRDAYRAHLEEVFRVPTIKGGMVARKVADAIPPQVLVQLVRKKGAADIAEACGLNDNQAEAVVSILSQPQNLFALELVEMQDSPSIELSDRDEFRDSSALSTGQKCTAILPILLFESANPLLIDQPEDNLDNSYVFETVVRSIRKVKAGRQMIFVTHNPNIPVLGDASMVFVMDSNRTQGGVARSGDVDHCKDDIVTLLEGGKEAFTARMERYHY
ncbi:MAG: AAA family ATPase [Verrucomicrobiaceae bacterium]|nr:AAA family ATPase [Verrucomicrobiaceae bacterium]